MEIDVNIEAHDLFWRRASREQTGIHKKPGALRNEIVRREMVHHSKSRHVIQRDDNLKLTPVGRLSMTNGDSMSQDRVAMAGRELL
jgi:hypothetical protein